jgi:hypothetical protein
VRLLALALTFLLRLLLAGPATHDAEHDGSQAASVRSRVAHVFQTPDGIFVAFTVIPVADDPHGGHGVIRTHLENDAPVPVSDNDLAQASQLISEWLAGILTDVFQANEFGQKQPDVAASYQSLKIRNRIGDQLDANGHLGAGLAQIFSAKAELVEHVVKGKSVRGCQHQACRHQGKIREVIGQAFKLG